MKNLMRIIVIGIVFTCCLPVGFAAKLTPAEEMTRCLPEGTVGFVAGSGMDSVGPAFKKTALGQILGNEQVQMIFDNFWAKAMENAAKEKGKERLDAARLVFDLAGLICKRPFIAGISENPNGGDVPISGFLIVDAGPIRKDINKILNQFEKYDTKGDIFRKLVGPCRMKVVKIGGGQYAYWGFAERKFVFAVCDKEGLILKNIFWPSKEIPKNLGKIPQAGDALVINYDYQAILSLMEKCMKKAAPEDYKKVMTLIDELGVADMGNVSARIGFSGADIVAGEAVEIPSPRKGLFNCYGNVDMAMFDLVEPQAMKAGAVNFDVAKFCDVLWGAIKKAVPEKELKMATQQITAFEKMADVDIREGLLGSFAGQGVFYSIPAGIMMDSPSGGFVAIARLKNDGAAFEKNMNALGQFAIGKTKGMLQISTVPKGDVTIHAWTVMPLAMMQVMPCWAVVDGNVVLASNAVLCGKAIDRIKSEDASKDSLRTTDAFKAAVKGLPDELTSLVYTDSKVLFKQGMMQVQRIWPMITMGAMQQGITLPAMLPNFDEAIKDLAPSASYSWYDKDGTYSRYKGSGVEIGAAAVAGSAVYAATVMPAIAKAKKAARKAVSITNLKSIGNACHLYAVDNGGKLPPSLDGPELKKYLGDSSGKILLSPRKPKRFAGPSYIYVEGQDASMDPQNIVAYENPRFLTDATFVVHLDGSAMNLQAPDFIKKLKATYERLGKEAPEIKFLRQIRLEKKNENLEQDFLERMEKAHKNARTLTGAESDKKQGEKKQDQMFQDQDHKFEQQMKKSQEKIKKQLQEQKKKKEQQNKEVKPKPVQPKKHKPKKAGNKAVADVRAS